jgi:adenosylcobinamide-phosphate guanylyltransferase
VDALLMCGGEGTRLDATVEKPLYPIAGEPMVERVRAALAGSRVDRTFAVTSPATPETARYLDCLAIGTPGEGYIADLNAALADERLSPPVLTVAADLPALDAAAVDAVLEVAAGALTVVVPTGRKRALGFSVDAATRHHGTLVVPSGVNVVAGGEGEPGNIVLTRDPRLAANVNRPGDARAAEWLLSGGCSGRTSARPTLFNLQ